MNATKLKRKGTWLVVSAVFAAGMSIAPTAMAQISTATIRGNVTVGAAPAPAGAKVTARNVANGTTTSTTTRPDGTYVLPGLAPGSYTVEVTGAGAGTKTETIVLSVGDNASLDLAVGSGAVGMERISVVANANRLDVRAPEVGTSISPQQIQNLPQVTRNFLSFADLAPGVSFDIAANTGQVKVQSGAQNQDNVNLFIDGVGQKNYILRGGISGLDSTRGNPFPQSAVSEYKVITQNYKAEFDQVSSAAITAVTKSGTNQFHGSAFWDYTESDWTEKDPFQKKAEEQGIKRPNAKQQQFGFDAGGAFVKDQVHYYFAYEGKKIEEPRQVVLQNDNLLPNAGIVPELRSKQGSTTQEFNENLLFGRVDAQLNADMKLTGTMRIRREEDMVPEDSRLSLPGNDKNRANDEDRFDLKHEWNGDNFLNEARLGWEKYQWNPHSNSNSPMIRYKISPSNSTNNTQDVIFDGGSPDAQNRKQSGTYLSNDFTWLGLTGHAIKGGAKVKDMKYELSGTSRSVDVLTQLIDNVTGIPTTYQVDPALTPASVSYKNKMWGLYIQDDWRVNNKLELNYGLRWDYEDNLLNKNYATPADRVAALYAVDVPRYGITPPPGQTYDQSLLKGGVNIGEYISTGSSRQDFKNAWQPRVGFSYDMLGNLDTVLFGGLGRAYDRAMANHALDESQKNAQPHGEIWLIKNDHKMPYTDQFSFGVRKALWGWNGEAGYMDSYAHNQFIWFHGNRDANGGFANQSPIDPLWGGPDGYGSVVLGDFVAEARTKSFYLRMDKPYGPHGWAVNATYTYSDAKTTNREWTNDIFSWTYGKPGESNKWNPSKDVPEHKLVVAGFTDKNIPWGIMMSGKLTLASALSRRLTNCSAGFDKCVFTEAKGDQFQQVDLGISKEFRFGNYGGIAIRLDVLNVFNTVNYGGFDDWVGGPGNPQNSLGGDNPNLGTPNGMAGPMRTFKIGLRYNF